MWRTTANWGTWRGCGGWGAFPFACLFLRRGVDRHLLLVFTQIFIEGEVGDVDEWWSGWELEAEVVEVAV